MRRGIVFSIDFLLCLLVFSLFFYAMAEIRLSPVSESMQASDAFFVLKNKGVFSSGDYSAVSSNLTYLLGSDYYANVSYYSFNGSFNLEREFVFSEGRNTSLKSSVRESFLVIGADSINEFGLVELRVFN
ncbi:MAG: hypothetical protein ABH803_00070 [Candidatus Micrarchaeota archaeon]